MKISIIGQVLANVLIFGSFLAKLARGGLKSAEGTTKRTSDTPKSMALRATRSTVECAIGCASYILDLFLPRKARKNGKNARTPQDEVRSIQRVDGYHEKNGMRALLAYRDPAVKRLIWDFKYHLKPAALQLCARAMQDELIADMSDRVNSIPFSKRRLVIHCPSSTFFKGEKKFDHMKELLCLIERELNPSHRFFEACIHAVVPNPINAMNVTTKAQHVGSRAERLAWARDRFCLSEKFIMHMGERNSGGEFRKGLGATASDHIYCIDDVTTTGASFEAIRGLVRSQTGLSLKCIALSH